MKRVLILLFVTSIFASAYACLNEHHISRRGHHSVDEFEMNNISFKRGFDKNKLEKELAELRSGKETDPELRLYFRNDEAVKLIKLGRYAEAEHLLDSLYKKHPSDYSVTVNLGTLHELMGNNQKALELIRKAVRLNENSHGGSEWFHLKILEYKLRNRTTAQIPGDDILSIYKLKKESYSIGSGVAWQLQERIPFTPVPDPVMAKILLEYADYLADSLTIKGAYVIYGIAEEYDALHQYPLGERKKNLVPLFKKYKVAIPDYHDYFETAAQQEASENASRVTGNLIEKGISLFSDYQNQQKERAKAKKRKATLLWWYGAGAAVVLGMFIFVLLRRKKKVLS